VQQCSVAKPVLMTIRGYAITLIDTVIACDTGICHYENDQVCINTGEARAGYGLIVKNTVILMYMNMVSHML